MTVHYIVDDDDDDDDDDDERSAFSVTLSPKTARTRNRIKRARSVVDAEFIVLVGAAVRPSEKHSLQSTAEDWQ